MCFITSTQQDERNTLSRNPVLRMNQYGDAFFAYPFDMKANHENHDQNNSDSSEHDHCSQKVSSQFEDDIFTVLGQLPSELEESPFCENSMLFHQSSKLRSDAGLMYEDAYINNTNHLECGGDNNNNNNNNSNDDDDDYLPSRDESFENDNNSSSNNNNNNNIDDNQCLPATNLPSQEHQYIEFLPQLNQQQMIVYPQAMMYDYMPYNNTNSINNNNNMITNQVYDQPEPIEIQQLQQQQQQMQQHQQQQQCQEFQDNNLDYNDMPSSHEHTCYQSDHYHGDSLPMSCWSASAHHEVNQFYSQQSSSHLISSAVHIESAVPSPSVNVIVAPVEQLQSENSEDAQNAIMTKICNSNKKNVVKNLMSAFKRFISDLQTDAANSASNNSNEDSSDEATNEDAPAVVKSVKSIPSHAHSKISNLRQNAANGGCGGYEFDVEKERRIVINIFNGSKPKPDSIDEMGKKFKRYISLKQFNHYTIRLLVQHPNYGDVFKHFIEEHALNWLAHSKVDDPNAHRVMIEFLKAAFEDISIIEKLKKHEKRKALFQ